MAGSLGLGRVWGVKVYQASHKYALRTYFFTNHITESCPYFSSSKQFRPVEKRGSENMKISGWDCDFDSWSKFSILLTA